MPLLPTEIIGLILSHCVPEPIATGSTGSDTLEHRKQRTTLSNVSLTCRRLYDIATPLLYRHLAITNSIDAVYLFCALVANENLRCYPRSFTSLLCLGEGDECMRTRKLWVQKFVVEVNAARLDVEAQRVFARSGIACGCMADFFYADPETLPQQLVAVILLLCKGLEDVMIQAPHSGESMWSEHKDLSFIRDALVGNAYPMESQVRDYQVPATEMDVLPSLKTWRIQIDPDALDLEVDWDSPYALSPIFIPQLIQQPPPRLTKIEIYGDEGDYLPELSEGQSDHLSILKQVQTVNLFWFLAGPATVERLLKHCNSLAHLTWTFSQVKWADYDEESDEFTLDSALSPIRETLESLHVESSMTNDNFAMPLDFFLSLTTLGKFQNLQRLKIDTVTLFGLRPQQRLVGPKHLFLASHLPPNMVSLEIIERAVEWYAVEEYDTWVQTLLIHFAETCAKYQPGLRIFVFKAVKFYGDELGGKQGFRGRRSIEHLEALFANIGVQFLWQWEEQIDGDCSMS